MESKKIADNLVNEEVYKQNKFFWIKVLVISFLMLLLALFINFPVEKTIKVQVESAIAKNRACPLQYKSLDVRVFFPKVNFKNLNIPGMCFKNPSSSLQFDKASVAFTFPSIWPLGGKFHAHLKNKDSNINLYPRVGLGGTDIRITKTKISGNLIGSLNNFVKVIKGHLNIEAFFSLDGNVVTKGDLKATSKNLLIPSQNIQGFTLPTLNIGILRIVFSQTKKVISIKEITIGHNESPIFAQGKGSIALNAQNSSFSKLDITAKVKLSDEFKKALPILNLLLGGKKQTDGFYNLKLGGTLARPSPTFL